MGDSGPYPPKQFLDLWAAHAGPLPEGPFRSADERIDAIILQEEALLDFGKQHPFSPEQLAELRRHKQAQGQEHEVFLPGSNDSEARVWKVTKQIARGETRWGIKFATPREYLARLGRLDAASNTHILIEGIGIEHRAPLLVTSMDYVDGIHLREEELDRLLREAGWERDDGDQDFLSYKLSPDGILMRDAHARNLIVTPKGRLVPIDVIFEGVGTFEVRLDGSPDDGSFDDDKDATSEEDDGNSQDR